MKKQHFDTSEPGWVISLRVLDAAWTDKLSPEQKTSLFLAVNDACREKCASRSIKVPDGYRDELAAELLLPVFEAAEQYDPTRRSEDCLDASGETEKSGLVRYVRMLIRHKLADAYQALYEASGLDGNMGMTGYSVVKDRQGTVMVDDLTGKPLIREKWSRGEGSAIHSFSLNQEVRDSDGGATSQGDFIEDTGASPEERLLQEEQLVAMVCIAVGVILDYAQKTNPNGKLQCMYYRMFHTERMVNYVTGGPCVWLLGSAARRYEKNFVNALDRGYLAFFSSAEENAPLSLDSFCCIRLKPEREVLPGSESTAPLRFNRDGWLSAKVPLCYFTATGRKAPANATISEQRTRYLQKLQAALQKEMQL